MRKKIITVIDDNRRRIWSLPSNATGEAKILQMLGYEVRVTIQIIRENKEDKK